MNNKIIYIMLSLLILAFTTNCISLKFGYYKEDEKKAKAAIESYRQHFNNDNLEELYNLTSSVSKKEKSKDIFFDVLKKMRSENGKIISMDFGASHVQTISTSSRMVTIAYRIKFDNKQEIQRFDWIISDKDESGLYELGVTDEQGIQEIKNSKKK